MLLLATQYGIELTTEYNIPKAAAAAAANGDEQIAAEAGMGGKGQTLIRRKELGGGHQKGQSQDPPINIVTVLGLARFTQGMICEVTEVANDTLPRDSWLR